MKHHVIISGTGRAGTTFLVQLLTALGLDTGFADHTSGIHRNCHAGMEFDIRHPDAPYIVKSPWLCDYLDEVLESGSVAIDHAIVPMRDLFSAAESRRRVHRHAGAAARPDEVPGGLWHTIDPSQQEHVLARQLHKLLTALAEHAVPTTLLHFPRLVREPDYLYANLSFLMNGIASDRFLETFKMVSRPELVHDFRPGEE